ncbi:Tn3 family transposase [Streptomyces scopuliridis]|uniref:Tn3 family transposase n=1 Tax=Streptomyces scopuliridis TaxID=452529 RepID=UPI00368520C1
MLVQQRAGLPVGEACQAGVRAHVARADDLSGARRAGGPRCRGSRCLRNWNSANTVLHYGKDGALTGPDKEHAETSMLALHLLQSSLVHINTLLLQRVLTEPAWARKLSDEDRRGLTALFWSNINPYGTFRLEIDKRLDFALPTVPHPQTHLHGSSVRVFAGGVSACPDEADVDAVEVSRDGAGDALPGCVRRGRGARSSCSAK